MFQHETQLVEQTFEQLNKRGALNHIQSSFISKVAKLIQQTNITSLKPFKHVRNTKSDQIASCIIFQYLKSKGLIDTLTTANTEFFNYFEEKDFSLIQTLQMPIQDQSNYLHSLLEFWKTSQSAIIQINKISLRKEIQSIFDRLSAEDQIDKSNQNEQIPSEPKLPEIFNEQKEISNQIINPNEPSSNTQNFFHKNNANQTINNTNDQELLNEIATNQTTNNTSDTNSINEIKSNQTTNSTNDTNLSIEITTNQNSSISNDSNSINEIKPNQIINSTNDTNLSNEITTNPNSRISNDSNSINEMNSNQSDDINLDLTINPNIDAPNSKTNISSPSDSFYSDYSFQSNFSGKSNGSLTIEDDITSETISVENEVKEPRIIKKRYRLRSQKKELDAFFAQARKQQGEVDEKSNSKKQRKNEALTIIPIRSANSNGYADSATEFITKVEKNPISLQSVNSNEKPLSTSTLSFDGFFSESDGANREAVYFDTDENIAVFHLKSPIKRQKLTDSDDLDDFFD